MQVVIGSDHAGYSLKKIIISALQQSGYEIIDCGIDSEETIADYPDIAVDIARQVLGAPKAKGIIYGIAICGTGIGIAIAANKIPGIQAAVCNNSYSARLSREHNDANILALGARVIGSGIALEIVNTFLTTDFAGGRHQIRVDKIKQLEKQYGERS